MDSTTIRLLCAVLALAFAAVIYLRRRRRAD
jgi:hypothetical protein